jgi:hypothetical protein
MVCFQNLQMLAAGVRPSSGAATSVGQASMELRMTCSWRTWLWPGTATLRILKIQLFWVQYFCFGTKLFKGVAIIDPKEKRRVAGQVLEFLN